MRRPIVENGLIDQRQSRAARDVAIQSVNKFNDLRAPHGLLCDEFATYSEKPARLAEVKMMFKGLST
jgi:hypothetical protein